MAASLTEIVESLKLRMFRWRETMLLDRFSKCGVLVFRMKRTTFSSVFEESDVQLFDLVSHLEHLQRVIYAAVVATGFFAPETVSFLAEAVSDCLRTRFNVCQETLFFLGKSKVVVVVDVDAKRVRGKRGFRMSNQHNRLYEELLCYKGGEDKEGEDEERGVMISVNEVEGEMEKGSDEKTLVLDVFGDYYDHYDCAEIIFSMMNSLSKTSDFLRQGCVISDEFQEFVEVKGGLKME